MNVEQYFEHLKKTNAEKDQFLRVLVDILFELKRLNDLQHSKK